MAIHANPFFCKMGSLGMVEKTPCKMVKKRQFAGKKSLTGPGIRSPVLRITMTDQGRLSNLD